MLKRDLISIAEKNNSNNELVEELPRCNDIFTKLQSDRDVTKQVNTELNKQIVTLERQCG